MASQLPVQVEAEKTELLQQLEYMGGECLLSIKVVYIICSTLRIFYWKNEHTTVKDLVRALTDMVA